MESDNDGSEKWRESTFRIHFNFSKEQIKEFRNSNVEIIIGKFVHLFLFFSQLEAHQNKRIAAAVAASNTKHMFRIEGCFSFNINIIQIGKL